MEIRRSPRTQGWHVRALVVVSLGLLLLFERLLNSQYRRRAEEAAFASRPNGAHQEGQDL
jgi:hypothetical protein